jgi:FkbM family methyltransferase
MEPMTYNKDIFTSIVNNSKTFMIIGANNGDSDDDLFLNKNLEYCVLIEPLPLCFEKLKNKFKTDLRYDLFNCAITDIDANLEMYTTDDINHPIIGSSSLVNYKRNGIVLALSELNKDPENTKVCVKSTTVSHIKNLFKTLNYDTIQIDTEGCDYIVFKQIVENNITFKAIQIETMWLTSEEKYKIYEILNNLKICYSDDGCNLRGYCL